jgi:hypothetical protein
VFVVAEVHLAKCSGEPEGMPTQTVLAKMASGHQSDEAFFIRFAFAKTLSISIERGANA